MLFHRDKTSPTPLTSLGFWEALVQPEDDALHEVLDVALLRAPHEHHPVMGEPFCGRLLAQLGSVPQLQLHLHRALRGDRGGTVSRDNTKPCWKVLDPPGNTTAPMEDQPQTANRCYQRQRWHKNSSQHHFIPIFFLILTLQRKQL